MMSGDPGSDTMALKAGDELFNEHGVRRGGVSERLWNEASAEVAQALHHPFVTGLARGTLPRWGGPRDAASCGGGYGTHSASAKSARYT